MKERSHWLEFREQHGESYGLYVQLKDNLFRMQSEYQTIEVFDSETFGKMLVLDGFINTTEKDESIYHEMLSHVGLYSHPAPKDVLIIGGGDGGVMREVLRHSGIESVDLVDLDEAIIKTCKEYFPKLAISFSDPRTKTYIEDGVVFVANATKKYDMVIIDSTDPVGPGKVLFEKPFYENLKAIMNKESVLVIQGGPGSNNMGHYEGVYSVLSDCFTINKPYTATIDTYGGLWTFGYCSMNIDPISSFREVDYRRDSFECFYYNEDIHKACFALPSYHKKRLFQN